MCPSVVIHTINVENMYFHDCTDSTRDGVVPSPLRPNQSHVPTFPGTGNDPKVEVAGRIPRHEGLMKRNRPLMKASTPSKLSTYLPKQTPCHLINIHSSIEGIW